VLTTGSLLGDFRIEDEIGRGGMGVVYRASQISLGRTVALKVIAERFAEHDAFRDRFVRESRLAASIDHPNVIPVYAAGDEDGLLYIAMRFVDGTDLRTLLARGGPLAPRRAANVVAQVAAALDAAHERGLVHRDVKPANVLVAAPGAADHVYLTDFGLTKRSASDSGLTASGEWVGTIDYVAPEQLRGDRVDGHADTYALGCVLYEALTGHVPFPREDDVAKLWAHISVAPPSAREVAPEVPLALAAVAQRAMQKDPNERFPTTGEMGRAGLAACGDSPQTQGDRPTVAAATVPSALAAPTAPTAVLDPAAAPPSRERPRRARGRRWATLAALGAVALATVLAVVLLGGGDEETPERRVPPKPRVTIGEVVGEPIQLGGRPAALGAGSEFVWVADSARGLLLTVVQTQNRLARDPIPLGGHPTFLTLGPAAVWVAGTDTNEVIRLNPEDRVVTDRIAVGVRPTGLGVAPGSVWVVNQGDGTVMRIDAGDRAVDGAPVRVGRKPVSAVYGNGSVWVTNSADDTVSRIDSVSRRPMATIRVGDHPEGLTFSAAAGAVWVANRGDDTVSRIDATTGRVEATIPVGDSPRHPKLGSTGVWVPNAGDGTLTLIDIDTDRVRGRPLRVGGGVTRVAVGFDSVWALIPGTATLTRVDPSAP
jgi:YVTN family beta-propeller protein